MAGVTSSYGAGDSDFWLVKTNASGHEEWNQTFGGLGPESAHSLIQTTDGGYALAGSTNPSGDESDVWLVKTNASGQEEWNKTFGGLGLEGANSLIQTTDGGYILAGDTAPSGDHDTALLLVKTDSIGQQEWNKTIEGGRPAFSCLVYTSDGGYVLAGTTNDDEDNPVFWLVKTNTSGQVEWDRNFGGPESEFCYSLTQTSDSGFILVGTILSDENEDIWIVKTDADGHMEWDRSFSRSDVDFAFSVIQASDGGYIISAETAATNGVDFDVWIFKIIATEKPDIATFGFGFSSLLILVILSGFSTRRGRR